MNEKVDDSSTWLKTEVERELHKEDPEKNTESESVRIHSNQEITENLRFISSMKVNNILSWKS